VEQAPGNSAAPADIYTETLTYLQEGKTFDEIAKLRDVTRQTVLRHLMVLGERGDVFDLSEHIEEHILEDVRQAAEGWSYGEPLAPVKERLRKNCSYDKLKIHLARVLMERSAAK
ncbi:MAG: helix-turn-helix domain-containing protein, partial [Myxococcota bacterium]|nr:helix-turn-helix domain-containing protein [Myxococcota bacterium]